MFDINMSNSHGAFEREAAEGSEAIEPTNRPPSGGSNVVNQNTQLSARSNIMHSTAASRVSPNGIRTTEQNINKPVPLDKLLLQTSDGENITLFAILSL